MKITYLDHSGFLVELEEVYYLFDYVKGSLPKLKKEKLLFVFVSHAHGDHYSYQIWENFYAHEEVRYILSKEIPFSQKIREKLKMEYAIKEENVIRIGSNDEITINGSCKISTLKSTDQGVAYIIEGFGKKIYHAGDLHLWMWQEESDDYNQQMKKDYEKEIAYIENQRFDIAFLPLDGRQRGWAFLGMDYFLSHVKVDYVVPMHLWGEYQLIDSYIASKEKDVNYQILKMEREGQSYEI